MQSPNANTQDLMKKLDEISGLLAAQLDSSRQKLWSNQDIANFCGYSNKFTRETVVTSPGFPRPVKLADSKQSLRWWPEEVKAFLKRKKGL